MTDRQAKIVLSAEDRTARVFAGLRSNLGGLNTQAGITSKSFASLAPLIGGAFTVGGLTAFVGGVLKGVDRLNDLADATGSSVENLSGLEDVAARTGTSMDTVGGAVLKLNKNLIDAQDPASNAARIFKTLGLNVSELSKLDPSQALLQVSKAFNSFADGPEKGRLMLDLLGKSTRETASFMKDLAEAGTISATVLTKQSGEAEKFNKQLFNLQKNSVDAARSLLNELLPSVNNLFEAYKKFGGLGGLAEAIVGLDPVSQAKATLIAVQAEVTRTQDSIDRMSVEAGRNAGNDFLKVRIDKARERLKGFQRELELAKQAVLDAANTLSPLPVPDITKPDLPKGGGGGGKTGGGSAVKDRITDAQAYLATLQRQLQGTQDLSVAETVLADIQAGRLHLLKGESSGALLDIAKQIDAAKRQQDQLKAEAEQVRELRAEQARLNSEVASLFEDTRTASQRLDANLGRARELLDQGAISAELYARRVEQLNDEYAEMSKSKDKIKELEDFSTRAAQNIQDALGDELSNVLDGNFKNIGDSFKRVVDRMVAEATSAQIMQALFGDVKNGAGIGVAFGDLINAGVGFFSNSYNGSKGGINGGSTILPNSLRGGAATGANLLERDMITLLHKGEAVVPKQYNPAAGGMGAGFTQIINFTISGPVNRDTQNQIATAAGVGLQRAMSRFA